MSSSRQLIIAANGSMDQRAAMPCSARRTYHIHLKLPKRSRNGRRLRLLLCFLQQLPAHIQPAGQRNALLFSHTPSTSKTPSVSVSPTGPSAAAANTHPASWGAQARNPAPRQPQNRQPQNATKAPCRLQHRPFSALGATPGGSSIKLKAGNAQTTGGAVHMPNVLNCAQPNLVGRCLSGPCQGC
jgi:hypothetical protein